MNNKCKVGSFANAVVLKISQKECVFHPLFPWEKVLFRALGMLNQWQLLHVLFRINIKCEKHKCNMHIWGIKYSGITKNILLEVWMDKWQKLCSPLNGMNRVLSYQLLQQETGCHYKSFYISALIYMQCLCPIFLGQNFHF